MDWQIAEAKSKLSELITRAGTEGPQIIRRRQEAYVVIPEADYRALTGEKPSFRDWLLNGPKIDDLPIPPRTVEPPRDLNL